MTKRVSLKERRAGDAKGIDAIFQGTDEALETQELLEAHGSAEAQMPSEAQEPLREKPERLAASEDSAQAGITEKSRSAPTGELSETPSPKTVLSKVTVYIRPEQVVAVEAIQLAERQRSGVKPDKSALMQEALDLLVEKYRTG